MARSVSLPLESNSILVRVSKELKKLKAWEESSTSAAETISIGLRGIADLYKCISDILGLPLTQQALSLHQHERCVGEVLEVSSKLLEICNATKEITLQMKEASRDLRSGLGGKQEFQESIIANYIWSRKKIMKNTKQTLLSLKRISGFLGFSSDSDERVSAVIQTLRCIGIISVSIHEALLVFLGSKPKFVGKKSFFSKLIRKGKGTCEVEEVRRNELENVDVAICGLPSESDEKIRSACKRLEDLEGGIEGIESGLDRVFKQLTQTRVLLLKIVSP